MDQALNAIRMAIAMEEKAARFYQEASEQTNDPQAKAALAKFADDEAKHAQVLGSLAEGYYLKQGRMDIPELTPSEYHSGQVGPIFCKRMEELNQHPDMVLAAVEKFAQAEEEAIDLYRKLSAESRDGALSDFFAKLADWEQNHLDLLRRQAEIFRSQRI